MGQLLTLEILRRDYRDRILGLAVKHGIENIRVFGSIARGDADEKSDVDFLCHLPQGVTVWEMAGLLYDLGEMLPVKVDLASDENLYPHVREAVLSQAVPL